MFPIGDENHGRRSMPVVTVTLIALNVLVFFLELSGGQAFIREWAFIPARFGSNPSGDAITVLSAMFMHGGWLHLGGNMLFLWIFGDNIEDSMGHIRIAAFYLLCGTAAALTQGFLSPTSEIPMAGASGAVPACWGPTYCSTPGRPFAS